jgi:hypothetical protein
MATKAKKTTKIAGKAKSAKVVALASTLDQPVATGSQADYDEFAPAAMLVAAQDVVPMRADLQLALQNVQVGVASVIAEKMRLDKLSETDVGELSSLVRLVLATIFADTQVDRSAPPSQLQNLLARCAALRALLLKTAESLAEAGLLARSAVETIRAGHGKLDSARDCIALAALYAKNASSLRGKHPLTAAQINEAAEVGTELLKLLKTGRSRRTPTTGVPAVDMRDRLWTLVLRRNDALWRAGAYLFGRDQVDTKVPTLQASRGGRPKKAATATAAGTTP